MSAKGYCYDNAFSESAFASLKSEVLSDGLPFDSKRAATTALFDYFETSTTEGASIVPSVIFPPTLSSIVIFKTKIPT